MYTIKTPNKKYSGVTEGVAFADGVGKTDCKITRNVLVNDYKYTDATDYSELKDQAKSVGETTKITATIAGNNIEDLSVKELKQVAKDLGLSKYSELNKEELIKLIESASEDKEQVDA